MGLFSKKKHVDVGLIGTDIHSHLIPGIDDGANDMQESILLIRQMKDLGYKKLIITPHVRYNSFDNDTSTFNGRLADLKQNLQSNGIDIELDVGAEQTIDEGFEGHLKNNELKCFGKRNYLLIEFSFVVPPFNLKELVFELQSKGYTLILAHPERYLYLKGNLDVVKYLTDAGVLLQMNINSLVDFYGKPVRKFAEFLISHDLIDLVGTDLHHQRHIDALKKALESPVLYDLVESGRLLNKKL